MIPRISDGQTAFEAYCAARQGTTYAGDPMPGWETMPEDIRQAWEAAAKAVIPPEPPELPADLLFNEREVLLIDHAVSYARRFRDAGAPGHNQFMLIAKLAKRIDWPDGGIYEGEAGL